MISSGLDVRGTGWRSGSEIADAGLLGSTRRSQPLDLQLLADRMVALGYAEHLSDTG